MKKIIAFAITCMMAATMVAQNSLLATLSHDGQIKTFYGATAYKDALAAADNGDAITLSSGQFTAADLTKAVTLHGAGMSFVNDSLLSHDPTIIQGDFAISQTDSTDKRLNIEGVYFQGTITYKDTLKNALFMKSRFNAFTTSSGTMVNTTFIHCRIASGFTLSSNSNAVLINCVVFNPKNTNTTASSFEFDNCVIGFYTGGSTHESDVINGYYKNSILLAYGYSSSYAVPSSCTAYNCVAYYACYNTPSTWKAINNKNSTNKTTTTSPFKSGYEYGSFFSYSDTESFELTDNAKAQYLGTDGTEVGLYGGSLPYEENPTTPQITKCNVAAKSTADGKLSVDIEVKAAE